MSCWIAAKTPAHEILDKFAMQLAVGRSLTHLRIRSPTAGPQRSPRSRQPLKPTALLSKLFGGKGDQVS
jgi:hypothetical protein